MTLRVVPINIDGAAEIAQQPHQLLQSKKSSKSYSVYYGDEDLRDDDDASIPIGSVVAECGGGGIDDGRRKEEKKKWKINRTVDGDDGCIHDASIGPPVVDYDDLPSPSSWPHRPVFICDANNIDSDSHTTTTPKPIPLGVPYHFETELFIGIVLIRLRDVPNSNNKSGDEQYFHGRRRKFQSTIQGRFKLPNLKVSDVVTGHEFRKRPLRNLPPSWILNTGTSLIGKLAPGLDVDFTGDTPYMYAPLAATSQSICVNHDDVGDNNDNDDNDNNEAVVKKVVVPNIATLRDIPENCRLFGGEHFDCGGRAGGHGNNNSGKKTKKQKQQQQQQQQQQPSSSQRKQLFAKHTIASEYTYDTNHVYTFDFYQNLLDVSTYSLDIGFTKMSIVDSMNHQPIQVMAKHLLSGKYLWCFQIWHEDLLLMGC